MQNPSIDLGFVSASLRRILFDMLGLHLRVQHAAYLKRPNGPDACHPIGLILWGYRHAGGPSFFKGCISTQQVDSH